MVVPGCARTGALLPACCVKSDASPSRRIGCGSANYLRVWFPGTADVRPKKLGNKLALEFTQTREGAEPIKFDAFSMSDGTLRVRGLITVVFQRSKPSLLVIEEPEASIHPGALGSILDVLRLASRSMQVIVTTHSPDVLDAKWIEDRHLRILTWEHGFTRISRVSRAVKTALGQQIMGAGKLLRSNAFTAEESGDTIAQ